MRFCNEKYVSYNGLLCLKSRVDCFTYFLFWAQGLNIYWHIGSIRNANADAARTEKNEQWVTMRGRDEERKRERQVTIPHSLINDKNPLTSCANSEHYLHWIEKEKHNEKRNRSSDRKTECLSWIYCLKICWKEKNRISSNRANTWL